MDNAIRLSFHYRDGKFEALAPQRVRMIVPELFPHIEGTTAAGHYAELRSSNGDVLRSVVIAGDLRSVEYPAGDPEMPFGRVKPADGMFVSALIVNDDRASEAALVEVQTARGAGIFEIVKRDLAVVSLARRDRA